MVLQRETEIDDLKKMLAEQRQLTEEVCQTGFCRWEENGNRFGWNSQTEDKFGRSLASWDLLKNEVAKQGVNLVLPTELGDVLDLVKK